MSDVDRDAVSACALCCSDEPVVHPEGEWLSGSVGGGLHQGSLVGAGSDAENLASGVVDGRSSASFRFAHVADNIRPRKALTEPGFEGHNNHMTTTQKIEALQVELADEIRRNASRGVSRSQRAAWLKRRIAVLSKRAA